MSARTMGRPGGGEGGGHGVGHGQRGVQELLPVLPRHARQPLGERLRPRRVAVGDGVDAEARLRNVGVREAGEDGDRDDAGIPLHLAREVVEPAHRPARRALAAERGQQRRLAEGRRRPQAPRDDLGEARARLDAALRHVHVRVRLVPVEEIGALDHGPREVAVEVERHRDRHRRADGAAARPRSDRPRRRPAPPSPSRRAGRGAPRRAGPPPRGRRASGP